MPTPNTADLLDAFDNGARASAAERALLLLATVRPEPAEQLSGMPLGWVTARLLELRGAVIGSKLDCLSDCRECGAIVECEVAIDQLTAVGAAILSDGGEPRPLQLKQDEYAIEFRLPTCGDLLALRGDPQAAVRGLAQGLICRASRLGDEIAPGDLPAHLHALLESAVLENDPLARVELALECPACGRRWNETLDVMDFVWKEISALAQRLLMDVARLANAFGWREADILAMSDHRRRRYLELLPS